MKEKTVDGGRLLEAYGDRLLRMCTLWLKDPFLAEDAVQDTLLKAIGAWGTFRGDCSEETFLTGIAVNVCRSYLRSPWHRRRDSAEALEAAAVQAWEPEDDTLTKAVLALPKKYREVVVLHYYQEWKAREIAQAMGLPLSTVTVRLSRARSLLRERLKGWYYDET